MGKSSRRVTLISGNATVATCHTSEGSNSVHALSVEKRLPTKYFLSKSHLELENQLSGLSAEQIAKCDNLRWNSQGVELPLRGRLYVRDRPVGMHVALCAGACLPFEKEELWYMLGEFANRYGNLSIVSETVLEFLDEFCDIDPRHDRSSTLRSSYRVSYYSVASEIVHRKGDQTLGQSLRQRALRFMLPIAYGRPDFRQVIDSRLFSAKGSVARASHFIERAWLDFDTFLISYAPTVERRKRI